PPDPDDPAPGQGRTARRAAGRTKARSAQETSQTNGTSHGKTAAGHGLIHRCTGPATAAARAVLPSAARRTRPARTSGSGCGRSAGRLRLEAGAEPGARVRPLARFLRVHAP